MHSEQKRPSLAVTGIVLPKSKSFACLEVMLLSHYIEQELSIYCKHKSSVISKIYYNKKTIKDQTNQDSIFCNQKVEENLQ